MTSLLEARQDDDSPMVFCNGWLLLRRVVWLDRGNQDGVTAPYYKGALPRRELHRFDESGDMSGATTARTRTLIGEKEWPFQPLEALTRWPTNPDKPAEVFIALGDIEITSCRDRASDRHTSFRANLIRKVFLNQDDGWFFPQHFLSILYLEPAAPLLPSGHASEDERELYRRMRRDLGQDEYVAIPQRFRDLFAFPGVLGPHIGLDLLIVRKAPLNRGPRSYCLPKSLLSLADAMAIVPTMEEFSDKLQSQPMMQESPGGYLQSIANDSIERSARPDRALAEAYRSHLRDRSECADAFHRVRALADDHSRATSMLSDNAGDSADDWLWTSECISSSKYRYGVIAMLRAKVDRAGNRIDRIVKELEHRERTSSDYLRDYFNSEVARSNLKLQRTVYYLSVIAVVIALVALGAQIL
jgi:hypothetical protein